MNITFMNRQETFFSLSWCLGILDEFIVLQKLSTLTLFYWCSWTVYRSSQVRYCSKEWRNDENTLYCTIFDVIWTWTLNLSQTENYIYETIKKILKFFKSLPQNEYNIILLHYLEIFRQIRDHLGVTTAAVSFHNKKLYWHASQNALHLIQLSPNNLLLLFVFLMNNS